MSIPTRKSIEGALAAGGERVAEGLPGPALLEGVMQMHRIRNEFQVLREQERTKRVAILADRDATIEQIRAQRDVIKGALAEAFELRRTGLQAQIQAMDKALDTNDLEALHVVMDGMVRTIQSSPFRDLADMREQLSKKDFVLRLD